MSATLDQIKNLDHDTLVTSGNATYIRLLEELCFLRSVYTRHTKDLTTLPEMNDLGLTAICSSIEPIRRIKYFADGRRLVYRVSGPFMPDDDLDRTLVDITNSVVQGGQWGEDSTAFSTGRAPFYLNAWQTWPDSDMRAAIMRLTTTMDSITNQNHSLANQNHQLQQQIYSLQRKAAESQTELLELSGKISSSSSAIMAAIQTISLAGPSSAASTASLSLSSAPLPVPALKQTDYPNIKYWTKKKYTAAKKNKKSSTGFDQADDQENTMTWYVETEEGEPVDGATVTSMRSLARTLYASLASRGMEPSHWSEATLEAHNYFEHHMCREFPQLSYGANNWKAHMIATDNYSSWYGKRHPGRSTKVKNEPTATTNRPLKRSAPSSPHALDSKREKLDVVEDPVANPQEGDERVKETVMEGPSKVLLDPIADPQDNDEGAKETVPEGPSEVLVVKDPLAAVFSDPIVAAKLLVPASKPSATTSTAPSTINSSMPSIPTEVVASSVPQAPVPATDAVPSDSDNTIQGPVTPVGTNTTTDTTTSSSGSELLSAVPHSVKIVKNKTVTKDRKASCRDGNNAK
ncbi:hypothetical protein LshimejAT787_0900410 [Lyophyllum shimeji]|uniref:Uncharacterized protein n=1 Tax=Lyophyllum shimeji TaxID=47721 RepID=A0A9P3US48_LYOSH|nr:hypothetical protein LshimejAT787_0900410 [Lyophyllum shimeji]